MLILEVLFCKEEEAWLREQQEKPHSEDWGHREHVIQVIFRVAFFYVDVYMDLGLWNPFVARLSASLVPQAIGTLYWDSWKSRVSHA